MKTPQINAANIYISLELSSERSFRSEDEMQNFLKQEFAQEFSKPSSVYCLQSDVALKEFDCLLLYPTGVPNSNFEIKFWYNDSLLTGGQCTLKVSVNPLESAAKSLRSLRRRSAWVIEWYIFPCVFSLFLLHLILFSIFFLCWYFIGFLKKSLGLWIS